MLNGVNISSIAIDAANRKWIGTVADGVYLVSADGQEILQHFTTDNSPLISDEIQSIAVNPQNGEVKITTVTGQLVYSGRANGGLFTWDGRNQSGKRVSSGVYNIISTNAEGKKAIVNRVIFIH